MWVCTQIWRPGFVSFGEDTLWHICLCVDLSAQHWVVVWLWNHRIWMIWALNHVKRWKERGSRKNVLCCMARHTTHWKKTRNLQYLWVEYFTGHLSILLEPAVTNNISRTETNGLQWDNSHELAHSQWVSNDTDIYQEQAPGTKLFNDLRW